jgi:hypothetical protein
MMLPGLVLGPNADAGVFLTLGHGLTRGELPYVDLWDHKPPLIYVIHAIGVGLPGDAWLGVWTLSVLALVATAWLLFPLAGLWPTVLAITISASFPAAQGGGMTETFAALFGLAAFVLAHRDRPFAAGLLGAAAVLTSLQLVAVLPALLVLTSVRTWWKGALAFTGPILLALPWMWDAVIVYSGAYLGLDKARDVQAYGPPLLLMVLPLAVLIGRPRSRLEWAAVAWLLAGIALIAMNGRLFPHYAAPLLIPLAILARIDRFLWAGPVLLVFALLIGGPLETLRILPSHIGPDVRAVAAWLATNTEPGDRVLSWGFEPASVALADRQTAGRYPYFLPLTTPAYTTPEMVTEWVAALESDPPTVIVDTRPRLRVPAPGAGGGRDLDIVQPFRDWVAEHYVEVARIGEYPVLWRRSVADRPIREEPDLPPSPGGTTGDPVER